PSTKQPFSCLSLSPKAFKAVSKATFNCGAGVLMMVVQLIAAMIEPFDGTLYDPCCGSGGMFIQSAEIVKAKQ
ncbi:SAM-dependent DNA methyltransferase, partial [Gemmiger formicilis]|nr:SAM-dependent DNA methyltransferase [Gemmiger formicilis]